MNEYLLQGGFIDTKINNRKNGNYLINKKDDDHYVIYLVGNGIKYYFMKNYDIKMNIVPSEMYIMNYGSKLTFKIIENIDKISKLKQTPFNKKCYECMFKDISKCHVDYAINISDRNKINDENALNIIQLYDINILFPNDEDFQNKLDEWLDKI